MADDGEDKQSKTEEPTRKRLEEALKRGQVPFSREISSFLILFVFALTLVWYIPSIIGDLAGTMRPFLEHANDYPIDRGGVGLIFTGIMLKMTGFMIMPLIFVMAAALLASFMQNGIVLSAEPIIPKFEKISIKKGIGRMFSLRSVIEFTKGILKITIVGVIAFLVVKGELHQVQNLMNKEIAAIFAFLLMLVTKLMVGVVIAMFFIALIDLIYQRFDYIKNLRMSKKEIKDEYKQQEGDPIVKQRLRAIRMERARNRMMSAVPEADVVITNPTHYAVALKYDSDVMTAPMLVAKGQDFMALNMKRIAEENDVPVVENPPLARALFKLEVDQEIPVKHYQAVAEVISYVYKLKGKTPKNAPRQQSVQSR